MKAILEFDLDNPEDRMAHSRCIKATEMAVALFEIYNNSWRHKSTLEDYRRAVEAEIEPLNIESLIS